MPDSHHLLSDRDFVNKVIWSTALDFSSNPKAMISEGAGLHMKLLFTKCLRILDFVKETESERDMQLQFCVHVLAIIKDRLKNF